MKWNLAITCWRCAEIKGENMHFDEFEAFRQGPEPASPGPLDYEPREPLASLGSDKVRSFGKIPLTRSSLDKSEYGRIDIHSNSLLRRQILDELNDECYYCFKPLREGGWQAEDDRPEIDHKYPRSKGGSDHRSNLVVACRQCNGWKTDFIGIDERDAHRSGFDAAIAEKIQPRFER